MDELEFDFPAILDYVTGLDGWQSKDGPKASVGIDYHYETDDGKYQACINLDQTWLSISIDDDLSYSGDIVEDEGLHPFIKGEIPEPEESPEVDENI